MDIKSAVDQMSFVQAKALADELWNKSSASAKALDTFVDQFPRGPMNLTPDSVRAMSEYKALKAVASQDFEVMRKFNGPYVKKFKKEISADLSAKRATKFKAE